MSTSAVQNKPRSRTDKAWRPGGTLGKQNVRNRSGLGKDEHATAAGRARTGPGRKRARDDEEGGEEGEDEEGQDVVNSDRVPEAVEDEDEEPAATSAKAVPKGKKQRKPTGGTGKKQKVFVEEKSTLLDLAASITGQAEAARTERIQRVKKRPAPAPKDPKEPSKAKQRQMDAARSVVAQRAKQKKEKKQKDAAPPEPKVDDGKKRVSFA
ncbi:hypothetical protein JCM10212_006550 [Sporobolomyces blumeae]